MHFTVSFKGHSEKVDIDGESTLIELATIIESKTDVPIDGQKLMAAKVGLIKVEDKKDKKINELFKDNIAITVIGTTVGELKGATDALDTQRANEDRFRKRLLYQRLHSKRPVSRQGPQSLFGKIIALPWGKEREAYEYLNRISNDEAVKKLMHMYKFKVGTLTELDPAANTDHQSRKLGLNVNNGEIIKLRIRTDDYEGFVSYKQVMKTLCHELSHNRWSEHDSNFWKLTNELEKQLTKLDPFSGRGNRLTNQEFYDPKFELNGKAEEGVHVDDGLAESQGQVLGSSSSSSSSGGVGGAGSPSTSNASESGSTADEVRRTAERRRR